MLVVIALLLFAAIFGGAFARGYFRGRGERKVFAQRGLEKARAAGAPSYAALVRDQMKAMILPTLWLTPASKACFSKLGGAPDLPAGFVWPLGDQGPRDFVAQLDLEEVRGADGPEWLPDKGRLYAFYDEERQGRADLVTITYSLEVVASPSGQPEPAFTERAVAFAPAMSLPSWDWLNVDPREFSGDYDEEAWSSLDRIEQRPTPSDAPEHRIGGYPTEIQSARLSIECEHLARGLPDPNYRHAIPPDIEASAKAWRLLLQIDSDAQLKMNWVDSGLLYLFIRESDARRGDFSQTVALCQFH